MITADYGVAGFTHRMWSFQDVVATPRPAHAAYGAHPAGATAAIAAQRKRRNAAPTIASVDRSFN